MHTRSIECKAICATTGSGKSRRGCGIPSHLPSPPAVFAGAQAGDPVHDIGLRLAVDDSMTIAKPRRRCARRPTPPASRSSRSCSVWSASASAGDGANWFERKIGRLETCTHLSELLGPPSPRCIRPCPTARPGRPRFAGGSAKPARAAVLHRRLPFLAHRRPSSPRCFRNSRPGGLPSTDRGRAFLQELNLRTKDFPHAQIKKKSPVAFGHRAEPANCGGRGMSRPYTIVLRQYSVFG